MNSGSRVPAPISRVSGTASHPTVGAWTSTSLPPGSSRLTAGSTSLRPLAADGRSSTVPKTPTPTPSTRSGGTPAADTASRSPATMWSATAPGSGRGESTTRSTVDSRRIDMSNSSSLTRVSPTSTPTTYPNSGSTRSSTRGRPPSDSTSPASTTRPSEISSAVTLLTVPPLSPLSRPRSSRLNGPSRNSLVSTIERFVRRKSRTVVRFCIAHLLRPGPYPQPPPCAECR